LTERLNFLSPKEVFEQVEDDSVYEYTVKQTTRYAANVRNEDDFLLTADKLVVAGFLLLTVYHKLHSERLYWSENEDFGLETARKATQGNKYKKLKSTIHFQNNDLANKTYDRGSKSGLPWK
jgi:hypothetical protein